MEVVCESLDKCLNNNDKSLVIDICRFIEAKVCMDCGIVDTLHTRWTCKHCHNKKKVIDQIRSICYSFQSQIFFTKKDVTYYGKLPKKLTRHLSAVIRVNI